MSDPVFAWDTPEFRSALATGRPGRALTLVRKAAGLTQAGFGELMHWNRTHVGRIERDEVATLHDVYQLGRAADALGIPRLALLPALLQTPDVGNIEITDYEGADVDRRQFGQVSALILGAALTATAAPANAAAPAPPRRIGSDHVRHFAATAERLWAHDNDFGSGGMLHAALDQFTTAQRILEHADYDTTTGTELAAVTADLGLVSGWLAYDSADQTTAARCYKDALVLAERGGDDSVAADIIDALRQQSWTGGRMREALQLSLRASDRSRNDRSARLQAILAAREGVAYAAVGDRRECERALAAAWRQVDRGLDDPDDPVRLHYITADEIRTIEAHARRYLGQHDTAADIYRDTIHAGHHPLRDEASYRAYYAASLADLGDTRTALTEGLTALALFEGSVKSPRLVNEMRPVYRIARNTPGSDADEFRTRFQNLATAA
ncbi:helix-turn-helix domain-containing protein [Nocardia cyriacigeorgica]|uniref:helix-turn-helix domain-containing protein n=1 Tax=Nocardia cyriacigeorgica TaxID=135487 RepID=UPI0018930DE3|nr:helix-turn-helix transcriptional regulator [Nocardia cyriacigeorgica]MBF6290000.1 helix-turn-helix transcriptional regulator [Nocardia cyriacigeorgica]